MKKLTERFLLYFILSVAVVFCPAPILAAERAVDNVDFFDRPFVREIQIHFNLPLQYLSHSPLKRSKTVRLRFKSLLQDTADFEELETFNWQASEERPLQEMTLEKEGGVEFVLTMHFSRQVEFEVMGGDDLRSVYVRVLKPAPEEVPAAELISERQPAVPAAPAATEPVEVNLEYPYAITLKTSMEPFGYLAIPAIPELAEHRVYSTDLVKNGQTHYRIRVGFFPTKGAAESIIGEIRKVFETAWISKVTRSERQRSVEGILELEQSMHVAAAAEVTPAAVVPSAADITPSASDVFAAATTESIPPVRQKTAPVIESFFGDVDITHPYAINLESSEGYRRFSVTIESDDFMSKITDESSDLMGPDWALKLRRKVQYEYVGSGEDRRLIVQVGPGDDSKGSGIDRDREKAGEIVEKLKLHPGIFQNYRLYVTNFITDDGKTWNRLRLGFFPSREDAQEVMNDLRRTFPYAWITKVSEEERLASAERSIATASRRIKPYLAILEQQGGKQAGGTAQSALPLLTEARVITLMDEAEKEMTAGNYRRAIQIFTRILQDPDQKERKKAQELLGLARERNGQLAHARAEYEKFLEMYPQGEEHERVKQRLAGLLTARATPKEKLKKRVSKDRTDVFGSLSQYAYYDELNKKEGEKTITRQSLSNDLVFNVRKRTPNFESRTLFVGGYEADGSSEENETRINTFYIDADNKKTFAGRIGRQSRSTGGVLGRFDGGFFSYKLASKLKANLVGGFPVDSADLDKFKTDKYFYGVSFDVGALAKYWNLSTYVINQEDNGLTDRQAAGGEIRFFHPRASFFALADYDLYYEELNTALFTGNINFPNRTTINMSADYRNNPILLPENALLTIAGKEILPDPTDLNTTIRLDNLDDLRLYVTEEEIREIAKAATFKTSTFMLGIVQPMSKKLQIGLDATATKTYASDDFPTPLYELIPLDTSTDPDTPAFAKNINAKIQEETPFEYTYALQFIGSSLLKEGDITILSGSYRDRENQEIYSAGINTRYPISRYWRLNPRVNATYSKNRGLETTELKIRPLFRMDYRVKKPRIHFTVEAGGEWINYEPDDSANTTSYFGSLGYRYDF